MIATVMPQFGVSLTDDCRVVIYDRNSFIIRAPELIKLFIIQPFILLGSASDGRKPFDRQAFGRHNEGEACRPISCCVDQVLCRSNVSRPDERTIVMLTKHYVGQMSVDELVFRRNGATPFVYSFPCQD